MIETSGLNNKEVFHSLTDINEKRTVFFRPWMFKGSFMKATGSGMKLRLDDFSIYITGEKYL